MTRLAPFFLTVAQNPAAAKQFLPGTVGIHFFSKPCGGESGPPEMSTEPSSFLGIHARRANRDLLFVQHQRESDRP